MPLPFLENPIVTAVVVGLIVLVFFVYLMLRRTVLGFREGLERGRQ